MADDKDDERPDKDSPAENDKNDKIERDKAPKDDESEKGKKDSKGDDGDKSSISSDLIRGHINTIILRSLYDRDKYGYEIMEEVETKSHGQYVMKQPTLYSALKRLEEQGFVISYWKTNEVSMGGRRKYFTLTELGKEYAERNQAEWEYSRTIIDNLISDKNFDFSKPAPSPVNFKLLKDATTRVRPVGEEEAEPIEGDISKIPIKDAAEPAPAQPAPDAATQYAQPAPVQEPVSDQQTPVQAPTPAQGTTDEAADERHERYMRLVEGGAEEQATKESYGQDIDTKKLIYNDRPATERDYRSLINGLFDNTSFYSSQGGQPENVQVPMYEQPLQQGVKTEARVNANVRYENEPTKSAPVAKTSTKSPEDVEIYDKEKVRYKRGDILLRCSLIVAIVTLVEFILTLVFKDMLGISYAYPIVILVLGLAQLLIFVVLRYTDYGKTSRKPTSQVYLTACTVVTVIFIVIICVVSFLLDMNYSSAADIMAYIVIPCIVALNIPLFATMFYGFTRAYR